MIANKITTPNNNPPSANDTTPDLPDTPPLYIKLDWGIFEYSHDIRYVLNGSGKSWDLLFSVYYIGTKEPKTIKYINITLQPYDRVDEPLGETLIIRITGPLEPHDHGIYDYDSFLQGAEYRTLGSIKIVKLIITYMDKTDEEISDENTIKSICTPSLDILVDSLSTNEAIKLAPPTEAPIHMDLTPNKEGDFLKYKIIYIGNNNSKSIYSLDISFKMYHHKDNHLWYPSASIYDLKPRHRYSDDLDLPLPSNFFDEWEYSVERIVITYENNTYIEIPKRMIDDIISEKNFDKAEKELEKLLHEDEEKVKKEAEIKAQREAQEKAKREAQEKARKEARRDECCSLIKKCAYDFQKTPNDITATSLLNTLHEYCPNDKVMVANYLTKKLVASNCEAALQRVVYDTNNNVTLALREDAKSFLARIAPNLNSEESYHKFKASWRDYLCSEIKTRSQEFQKTPNDCTANSLLAILKTYCPDNDIMLANYLTTELAASSSGKALQKIVFDTKSNLAQATRDDAKSFLARIAPELNSEESYKHTIIWWHRHPIITVVLSIILGLIILAILISVCIKPEPTSNSSNNINNNITPTPNHLRPPHLQ